MCGRFTGGSRRRPWLCREHRRRGASSSDTAQRSDLAARRVAAGCAAAGSLRRRRTVRESGRSPSRRAGDSSSARPSGCHRCERPSAISSAPPSRSLDDQRGRPALAAGGVGGGPVISIDRVTGTERPRRAYRGLKVPLQEIGHARNPALPSHAAGPAATSQLAADEAIVEAPYGSHCFRSAYCIVIVQSPYVFD